MFCEAYLHWVGGPPWYEPRAWGLASERLFKQETHGFSLCFVSLHVVKANGLGYLGGNDLEPPDCQLQMTHNPR